MFDSGPGDSATCGRQLLRKKCACLLALRAVERLRVARNDAPFVYENERTSGSCPHACGGFVLSATNETSVRSGITNRVTCVPLAVTNPREALQPSQHLKRRASSDAGLG